MVNLDYYTSTGFVLALLAQSPYHRRYEFGTYFRTEILPAMHANQIQLYHSDAGVPQAMVTWAWISETVETEMIMTGRSLRPNEWCSGDRLLFNDGIVIDVKLRDVMKDLMEHTFAGVPSAISLRRNPDGSVRRVNRWTRPKRTQA